MMTRNEKLTKLADLLDNLPEEKKFSMFRWGTPECGTAKCAAGWAALDPEFNAQGLYLGRRHPTSDYAPAFWDLFGYEALGRFFGLDSGAVAYLFSPGHYIVSVSRSEVALRIRKFAEDGIIEEDAT